VPAPPNGSIVILTGAGISAESGLRTFRDAEGLWEDHRVEDVATSEAFDRDPGLVLRFYNQRRRQLGDVEPNAAHQALARLEREWPGPVWLVTQNVDDLHERAGSKNLIHMHGELHKIRCSTCQGVFPCSGDIHAESACPSCRASYWSLRPQIVWFGETPLDLERIYDAVQNCALFAAIGTSGNVYPAAGLVSFTPKDAHTIELNLEPSAGMIKFREARHGKASEVVPTWVEEVLAGLR